MIRLPAVSSTVSALASLLLTASVVGACTALPRYGVTLPPLPPAALHSPDHFTMPDGAVLPARAWLPAAVPKAIVLALHGFNDSRDAWDLPAPAVAKAGIALYAPDQRGFGAAPARGTWPGVPALADDAAEVLRQLRARYPGIPLYAMGESMGGAILMALAARPDAPQIEGWVLLSPAVWSREQMGPAMSAALWLASGLLPGLSLTGAESPVRVRASDNNEALLALVRNPLTIRRTRLDTLAGLTDAMDAAQTAAPALHGRTLILYGAKDMLVPETATAHAWSRLPEGTRYAYYPNGYHLLLRDLNRTAPLNDVIAWITDPGAFLPAGADAAAAAWRTANR